MKTRSTSSKNLPENCVEKRVQNDRIEKTEYQNCNSLKYRNILHRPDRIIRAFFSSFHRLVSNFVVNKVKICVCVKKHFYGCFSYFGQARYSDKH